MSGRTLVRHSLFASPSGWRDPGRAIRTVNLGLEHADDVYATVPEGVTNDRWGDTHGDFRTSEYQFGLEHEAGEAWQNTRGIPSRSDALCGS